MTAQKNRKRLVRARMEKTGESYQAANRAIETSAAPRQCHDERELCFLLQHKGESFELTKAPFTIGRNATCNLRLEDDALVSRVHATLQVTLDGRVELVDHESRNGVLVNGRRITARAEVMPGDSIRIGNSHMSLGRGASRGEDSVARPAPKPAPTPRSGFEAGTVIGERYRLLGKLSPARAALYGEVGKTPNHLPAWELYDAEHALLGGGVTIKLVSRSAARANPALREELLREGRALRRAAHPRIVQVYDIIETDMADVFLVLERVPGDARTLGEYLTSGGDRRGVVEQLVSILDHVRQQGVTHRLHDSAVFVENGGGDGIIRLSAFSSATIAGDPPIERMVAPAVTSNELEAMCVKLVAEAAEIDRP